MKGNLIKATIAKLAMHNQLIFTGLMMYSPLAQRKDQNDQLTTYLINPF